ncbi:C6 zinc finger domain protein [Penicillium herquei]|nr:C6 zinc finger domain protein [Penicillium herquei]
MDSIAMVSYVFMGIELLLNNYKGALNHYYHGRSLLESYNLSTKILGLFQRIGVFMMLLNILGLFQRLNVVALHFSHFASLSPKKDALVWTPDGPFKDMDYAEGALDWLAYRSMKLTMRLYASSSQPDPSLASTDLLSITQMQQSLSRELDDWSLAVTYLIASKDNCPSKHDVYRMLQARWSVCKVLAGIGESSRTTNEASRKVGRLAEIISGAIGHSTRNTSHEGWEVDYNYLRMAAEVNEKFLQEFGHTWGKFMKLPGQTIGQLSKSYLDQRTEALPQ